MYKLTSDNEFLARIFDCWEAGKLFSIQLLDLSLSQQDLQKKLKIGQKLRFLCPKWILDRDFALSGEIINDNKFSFFCNIFYLNFKILSYLSIL